MIKHSKIKHHIYLSMMNGYLSNELYLTLEQYIAEQEKKDEIIDGVKEILALNYSYQEIGIKISRLFKRLEEEMK